MDMIRLLLVGEPTSGKSSILNRYNNDGDEFSMEKVLNSSSGVDYTTKEIYISDSQVPSSSSSASLLHTFPEYSLKSVHNKLTTTVKLQVWDFAGHEKHLSMRRMFFNRIQGVLIVLDVTDNGTIDRLEEKVNEIKRNLPADCTLVLCGAKVDLLSSFSENRRLSIITRLRRYSKDLNIDLYLTSAATGENIERMFSEVATKIHLRQMMEKDSRCFDDDNIYHYDDNRLRDVCTSRT